MNKNIYFIGSETTKDYVSSGVLLLGLNLKDFVGWHVNNIIIYELNNIDTCLFHIPENLLIITNNIKLKDTHNKHIFYHQKNEFKFSFSKFLFNHLKKDIKTPTNFYDIREEVRILYLDPTKELENLLKLLVNNKHYLFKNFRYSKYLSDQPVKTLIYIDETKFNSLKSYNLPTIYKGLNSAQKKELKRINSLVPKIFINKINRFSLRKILNLLN